MAYQTIRLDCPYAKHEEGVLGGAAAAAPGTNVVLQTDGEFDPGAGVANATRPCVLTENALEGETVTDTYAVGDVISYVIPLPGDVLAVLVASGQDIDIGELIKANASGLYVTAGGAAPAQFESLEDSGGALAANTLMKVRAL